MNRKTAYWILGVAGSLASIFGLLLYTQKNDHPPDSQQIQSPKAANIEGDNNITVSGTKNIIATGSDADIIQGNNNTINKNVYMARAIKLTEESFDVIATDYVGSQSRIEAKKIVRPKGGHPFFLIIFFEPGETEFYSIHSVKEIDGRWRSSWRARVPAHPYGVGRHAIESREIRGSLYMIYEGCYPHFCPQGWGLFVYDVENDSGYSIVSDYVDEHWAISLPQGLPDKRYALWAFQDLLFEYIVEVDDFSETRATVLLELPTPAQKLPDIKNKIDDRTLREINRSGLNLSRRLIRQAHVGDFDGDGSLDWLIYTQPNGDNKIYLISERTHEIAVEELEKYVMLDWFTLGLFRPINGRPYLVFGVLQGAAGNFGVAIVFRYSRGAYVPIDDEATRRRMRKEFGIVGALDEPL